MNTPKTVASEMALAIAQGDGTLVISIEPIDDALNPNPVFPINEIVLTSKSNQSLLIYIPEIGGAESHINEGYRWDNDGIINKIKYFYPQTMVHYTFCSPDEANFRLMQPQKNNARNTPF